MHNPAQEGSGTVQKGFFATVRNALFWTVPEASVDCAWVCNKTQ
jgi:hypothetical protein